MLGLIGLIALVLLLGMSIAVNAYFYFRCRTLEKQLSETTESLEKLILQSVANYKKSVEGISQLFSAIRKQRDELEADDKIIEPTNSDDNNWN